MWTTPKFRLYGDDGFDHESVVLLQIMKVWFCSMNITLFISCTTAIHLSLVVKVFVPLKGRLNEDVPLGRFVVRCGMGLRIWAPRQEQ